MGALQQTTYQKEYITGMYMRYCHINNFKGLLDSVFLIIFRNFLLNIQVELDFTSPTK